MVDLYCTDNAEGVSLSENIQIIGTPKYECSMFICYFLSV